MKLNATKIDPKLLNIGLLLIRLSLGGLMIANHGWMKIIKYEVLKTEFFDFIGLGSNISLILAIVAEVLCSILLVFGLYTRLALIPLIVTMLVAISSHGWEIFGAAEIGFLYLLGYVFLFLVGPGDKSIDARMNKRSFY
ncbi:DoxX family protein [Flavobacterium sp. xlx-214]|uniref:DoxX family protein n=1 Tax=unclassified Flavobacterium TaxID=196869 RepID=UPI0013D6E669|nr:MULTISPECIES: DoxX family protein [unclassified Flavobacterium]MBA5793769.1 DoxX family protein [Flavobacterium sp. xlx-221]QMI83210.1 DoxX family protein [Flavobacterium sp. xlx-214]